LIPLDRQKSLVMAGLGPAMTGRYARFQRHSIRGILAGTCARRPMRLLVLFLVLLAALAFVQIEWNDCYWLDDAVRWASCLTKL
jgi:hypothetical protein